MSRVCLALFCFVLLVVILCCNVADGAKKRQKFRANKRPKCSRLFSKIPVHRGFRIDKFTGTWYTVTRTTNLFKENTYESQSIEITKNADNSYIYSLTGKKGEDTCMPVETGKIVTTKRDGQLQMKPPGNPNSQVTMIISYTGYKDIALVYYCFKYKPGRKDQCSIDGTHVEILSRSEKPTNKKLLKQYITRATKRLCITSKQFEATKPGQCKIPDILEAAKKKKNVDMSNRKEGFDQNKAKCRASDIDFIKDFDLRLMEGIWYEISRTRFTFNNIEAVVTRHTYDEYNDVINSLYTGAYYFPNNDTISDCITAIHGMSRTKVNATEVADMEGRIGFEESGYVWAPMKIMYYDDTYLMFYACYGVDQDGYCSFPEITLVGRTNHITEEKRMDIYDFIPAKCFKPQHMVDTKFFSNCSNMMANKDISVAREPSDCNLGNMPTYADYEMSLLAGTWYLYASISYTNDTLSGVVMTKITPIQEDKIVSHIHAFENQNSTECVEYYTTSREMCYGTGDHIVTPHTGDTGRFYFSKILNVSSDLLVEYTCSIRTLDNTCEKAGIQFNVYTKNLNLINLNDPDYDDDNDDDDNEDDNDNEDGDGEEDENNANNEEGADEYLQQNIIDLISNLALSVCLDPNDLEFENAWCSGVNNTKDEDDLDTSECDIDSFYLMGDIDDFIQEGVYGYWYEVVRQHAVNHLSDGGPLLAYLTSDSNETLQMYYTNQQEQGENTCTDVKSTILLPRCYANTNGDYLARYGESDTLVTYVPFKIVFTDYNRVMLTYVCEDVHKDGQCSKDASFLRIWSRNSSLSEKEKEEVFESTDWYCLETSDASLYRDLNHDEGSDCMAGLETYIIETIEKQYDVADVPDVDGDQEEQHDQPKDKQELDDIDLELLKSDKEFYDDQ